MSAPRTRQALGATLVATAAAIGLGLRAGRGDAGGRGPASADRVQQRAHRFGCRPPPAGSCSRTGGFAISEATCRARRSATNAGRVMVGGRCRLRPLEEYEDLDFPHRDEPRWFAVHPDPDDAGAIGGVGAPLRQLDGGGVSGSLQADHGGGANVARCVRAGRARLCRKLGTVRPVSRKKSAEESVSELRKRYMTALDEGFAGWRSTASSDWRTDIDKTLKIWGTRPIERTSDAEEVGMRIVVFMMMWAVVFIAVVFAFVIVPLVEVLRSSIADVLDALNRRRPRGGPPRRRSVPPRRTLGIPLREPVLWPQGR